MVQFTRGVNDGVFTLICDLLKYGILFQCQFATHMHTLQVLKFWTILFTYC